MDMVDPFTGASSYRTSSSATNGSSSTPMAVDRPSEAVSHFPYSTYTTFNTCDAAKVLDKIKEFNGNLSDDSLKVADATLEKIIKFTTVSS